MKIKYFSDGCFWAGRTAGNRGLGNLFEKGNIPAIQKANILKKLIEIIYYFY